MTLEPALVARTIVYKCGCKGDFIVKGGPEYLVNGEQKDLKNDWHIVVCYAHAKEIAEVYKRLEVDWKLINNGKL